jgi:hypothetical protein
MQTRIKVSLLLTNILIGFLSVHAPVSAKNTRFNCPDMNKTLETLVSAIDENTIICRAKNPNKFSSNTTDILTLYRLDEQGKFISAVIVAFSNYGERLVLIGDRNFFLSNTKEPLVGFLLNQRTFVEWITPPNPAIVDKYSPDLKLILDIANRPEYSF